VSGVLHAGLLFLLALQTKIVADEEVLTEVTWVEPAPIVSPPPVATAPAVPERQVEPAPEVVAPEPTPAPERFERPVEVAEVAPKPQVSTRTADALASRVASLQAERPVSKPGLSTALPDPKVSRPTLAAAAVGPTSRSGRVELTREEGTRTAPVSMTRGTPTGTSRPLSMATIAAPKAERGTAAMSGTVDSTLVRDLAGARLLGPVADRPLVSHQVPTYPEWAKKEGVEGSVSIRFLVQPDGRVRENLLVERTSGFEDFDANATRALLAWRFEPLTGSSIGDQWGVITFNYRLSGR
jgi:TonB family protein